jgi:hypothetical protein
MFLVPIIALGILLAAAVVALNAGRIPYLREWTGAAPLQPEEADDK